MMPWFAMTNGTIPGTNSLPGETSLGKKKVDKKTNSVEKLPKKTDKDKKQDKKDKKKDKSSK